MSNANGALTESRLVTRWVEDMVALCLPDKVVWIDGSDAQRKALAAEACAIGEIIELNQEKHPGCFYHRSDPQDVARVEDKTFICCPDKKDAGVTNNWKAPEAANFFRASMRGRTMYVVPFSMAPVDSSFRKIGIELTDSIYVVLNMEIMCQVGKCVLDALGMSNDFTRCLHSKASLDPDKRRILHFPQDNTIWSVNSAYGGNVLLGKKCLALRIASWMARDEGWLAEHMLILGIETPDGTTEYVAAAFPSACGKTNLAMIIPPAGLRSKGYRIWTVGDDIAWIHPNSDGRLWAMNPEAGFFCVAPGTNSKTNPNGVETFKKNTIFTNVVLGKDGTVWWEESDAELPADALDWRGRPWKPGMTDENGKPVLGAHPNSRFTAPLSQCPTAPVSLDHHHGVPISAIIFGGRREHLVPLVYESTSWNHGVLLGASLASERTSAQHGKQGEVRRDPFAMLPFCGYNMADYFKHWINIGRTTPKAPKIFHVNWFRKDQNGKFLWPGYSENLRVVEWILQRARGEGEYQETPIGNVPTPDALDMTGLDLAPGVMEELLKVNPEDWKAEAEDIKAFFGSLGPGMPSELHNELKALRHRLRVQ